MGRGESAVAFAVMAGGMFLVSTMGPIFVYAFRPGAHDPALLAGFAVMGLGVAASLYGISTILSAMAEGEAPPRKVSQPPADEARAELMGDQKTASSPKELMSSVRTLIELENWKLAHQRAFELVESYPESDEAAKVKKNLGYLEQKAAG